MIVFRITSYNVCYTKLLRYDYYDEVNTTSPAMRMVFTDKSAIDGDYFQNGFGDMITEMNTIITKMNKNYGLELEPMENK